MLVMVPPSPQRPDQRVGHDSAAGVYVVLTDLGEHVEVEWSYGRKTWIRYPGLSMEDTIAFVEHALEDTDVLLRGAADYRYIDNPA